MKAAVIREAGTVPEFAEFPEPEPEPEPGPEHEDGGGRVVVDLVAAGLHPVVRSLAGGGHYGSAAVWPQVPGVDAVARTDTGALVYTGQAAPPFGTMAERIAVPSRFAFPLPEAADPVVVAAGMVPGLSSWLPLRAHVAEHAEHGAPHTVLVLGATGVAGLLAVQNAARLGAVRIVAAGRNPAALRRAEEFGAETVRLSGHQDSDANALRQALDGATPDLVLDFLWGGVAEAALAALHRRSLAEDTAAVSYVQIGDLAGSDAVIPAAVLRSRRIQLRGSGAGSLPAAAIAAEIPAYLDLLATGAVELSVAAFPLSDVAAAWTAPIPGGTRAVLVNR